MGGRLRPIEAACRAIDRIPDTKIARTSGLWNTKAMYITNQDDFLNGVCEVRVLMPQASLVAHLLYRYTQNFRRWIY
jgi:2-amino-4-hydroxy-6-hydroxymethyldihydropteridine diphosphokinase / dihydropteroate synthase